ncbi:MAG: head maturation protease, ClpP-related [Opitutia bacterium]
MRAAADQAAVLSLLGDVGWEITPAGVAAELKKLSANQPLTISINSYGGDALAGIAIHNMLARHAGPKTVIVEGIAASAASLIAMAGDRIVMPGNAFLMIHEAWGGALGDAETMRQQADVLDQISGAYRRTYAGKSGKDEETVAALMRAETWFDADMAVAEGFASETAEPAEIRAFAALDPNRYAAAPAAFCGLVRAARDAVPTPAPAVSNPPAIPPAVAKEIGMSESIAQAGGNSPAQTPAPVAPAAASIADLRGIAERNGLPAEFALTQLERGATREAALEAALEAVAARSPAPIMPNSAAVSVIRDERDTLRARWTGALSAQLSNQAPPAESREFANMGFHGLLREIAVANGVKDVHRMSGADLAEMVLSGRINAQHSTSDFPLILVNSANKSVQGLFGQYPNTWASWTREVDVADFKTITSAFAGQFPEVAAISEGAPYTYGSIAEEGQTYAVQERGRLVALTRQALVNDDTRAFQDVLSGAALAGYTALRRVVFGILTANANWPAGGATALLAAGRNNLGTAGNLAAGTFAELRALLTKQTSPARAGESAAPLPPPSSMVLLVGPDEEDTALELLGNRIVPSATGAVLPDAYRSSTSLVMEPFLDTVNDPYYLCRGDIRGVEIAYLQGQRAPTITSAEDIRYSGMTFRVVFDFGAAAVQPRAMAANLG